MTASPQLALPVDVTDTGEVRLYKMVLPFLPPSKNVYDKWLGTWQSSAKGKWVRAIAREADAQQMPRGVDRIGLSATLVFPSRRGRDLSNYAQCLWHFVPDALQRCDVLTNDSDGHIEYGPNLGVKFAYDLRPNVSKLMRQRTVLRIAMRVETP